MGDVLIIIGFLMVLGSLIWLLVIAFGNSIWWGFAVLILPGAPIIFCLLNLADTWSPLTLIVVGLIAEWAGKAIGGTSTFFISHMDIIIIIVGAGGGYLAKTMGFLDSIIPVIKR